MDPTSCKRQKHDTGHNSSPGTQSLSSIISHNRSARLTFLEQFDELKYGSVTEEYKAIERKRHELISTLEKLQQVPIKLPCASAALETSDARLHGAAQSGKNISSDNIIDLDQYDVGDHTHGNNMDNIGAQKMVVLLDSDDEDMVKSFGDGNLSGSKQNIDFIQECMLAEQPCQDQDIIMRDNENINSEAQLVVNPGKHSMGIDNEPKDTALSDGHDTSEPQQLNKQGHDDINIYNESRGKEKETREGRGEGWLRGVAQLPRLPATEEQKTLITPSGKDNWVVIGEGRIPNGVITILLKNFWPGLFNPRPNADPPCEERVLATRWEHYEAASLAGYETHAKAVITRFWEFHKVSEEDKATADVVLVAAAKKMLRQIPYEARWVAISHYYHNVLHQKMSKEMAKKKRPPMTREQYLDVIPAWCFGKSDGWKGLVDRWLGEDAAFAATSSKNRSNRGTDGTHGQGNRSHHRHKKVLESVMKQSISDMKAFEFGRVRKKPKDGEGKYYGKTGENLTAYTEEFRWRNGEDCANPIESETDETAVILSGHGKQHGRHALLDRVIQPAVSYTQLRATSPSVSTANTSWAQPSGSRQKNVYIKLVELHRLECEQHAEKVRAYEEYRTRQMENMYAAIQTDTVPPPMGPAPPLPGPYPRLPSFEEFSAHGSGTPGSYGSIVGGGTPSSRCPDTPVWLAGGGGGGAGADADAGGGGA